MRKIIFISDVKFNDQNIPHFLILPLMPSSFSTPHSPFIFSLTPHPASSESFSFSHPRFPLGSCFPFCSFVTVIIEVENYRVLLSLMIVILQQQHQRSKGNGGRAKREKYMKKKLPRFRKSRQNLAE